MSLTNPNIIDKIRIWLQDAHLTWTAFKYKRVLIYSLLGLILFAGVLFAMDRYENWRRNAQINKARQDVNVAMQDLANVKSNVNADKDKASQAVANLQMATNTLVSATDASEAARTQTNAALANVAQAVNANLPTNTTADDLKRQLDGLEIK